MVVHVEPSVGPFATEMYVRRESLSITGEMNAYSVIGDSGKTVTRLKPEFHLYVKSKQLWYQILDGLPQYQGDMEW